MPLIKATRQTARYAALDWMPWLWPHRRVWAEVFVSLGWTVAAGCRGSFGLGSCYTAVLLLVVHSPEGRLDATDGTEAVWWSHGGRFVSVVLLEPRQGMCFNGWWSCVVGAEERHVYFVCGASGSACEEPLRVSTFRWWRSLPAHKADLWAGNLKVKLYCAVFQFVPQVM